MAKRDLWETLGDYPEARASLTERGCQLLRKDGLLDEELFASMYYTLMASIMINNYEHDDGDAIMIFVRRLDLLVRVLYFECGR